MVEYCLRSMVEVNVTDVLLQSVAWLAASCVLML